MLFFLLILFDFILSHKIFFMMIHQLNLMYLTTCFIWFRYVILTQTTVSCISLHIPLHVCVLQGVCITCSSMLLPCWIYHHVLQHRNLAVSIVLDAKRAIFRLAYEWLVLSILNLSCYLGKYAFLICNISKLSSFLNYICFFT